MLSSCVVAMQLKSPTASGRYWATTIWRTDWEEMLADLRWKTLIGNKARWAWTISIAPRLLVARRVSSTRATVIRPREITCDRCKQQVAHGMAVLVACLAAKRRMP